MSGRGTPAGFPAVPVINGEKTEAEAKGMDVFTMMTVNPPF